MKVASLAELAAAPAYEMAGLVACVAEEYSEPVAVPTTPEPEEEEPPEPPAA